MAAAGQPITRQRADRAGQFGGIGFDTINPNNLTLTPDQQRQMLQARYRTLTSEASNMEAQANQPSFAPYPGRPIGRLDFPSIAANQNMLNSGVFQSEEDQGRVSYENYVAKQREQQQQQLETMREIEQSAQNIGNTLGAAATQFITKMATLREIGQQLATMALQSGLSQAFTAGARGIFGAFNAPAAQRTPGVDPS
jgi:hypothetical protein